MVNFNLRCGILKMSKREIIPIRFEKNAYPIFLWIKNNSTQRWKAKFVQKAYKYYRKAFIKNDEEIQSAGMYEYETGVLSGLKLKRNGVKKRKVPPQHQYASGKTLLLPANIQPTIRKTAFTPIFDRRRRFFLVSLQG